MVSYRRKHRVGTPRAGQQTVGKRQSQPVRWKQVSLGRLSEGSRSVWLDEPVCDYDANNWKLVSTRALDI